MREFDPQITAAEPQIDGQPFLLDSLAHFLRICGDPDWRVLVSGSVNYSEGVPIGRNAKMPRTPAVYRRKIRWRSYVDELADGRGPESRENYRSIQGHEDELEAQFKEEEALGMMQLVSEEAAKREFGSTLVVAALGALQKSDSSWRVLHQPLCAAA